VLGRQRVIGIIVFGKTEDHWSHCVWEDRIVGVIVWEDRIIAVIVLGKTGSLESLCSGRQRIIAVIVLRKTEDCWSHCVRKDRGSLESLC